MGEDGAALFGEPSGIIADDVDRAANHLFHDLGGCRVMKMVAVQLIVSLDEPAGHNGDCFDFAEGAWLGLAEFLRASSTAAQ